MRTGLVFGMIEAKEVNLDEDSALLMGDSDF